MDPLGKPCSHRRWRHGFAKRRGFEQPGPALLAQPVAVAADRDHVAVVQETIEKRRCDHGVTKYSRPPADRAIAGHQHADALVAARHQLEEQMCGSRFERQVTEFVDDHQLRLAKVNEAILEPPFVVRLGELGHQLGAGTTS